MPRSKDFTFVAPGIPPLIASLACALFNLRKGRGATCDGGFYCLGFTCPGGHPRCAALPRPLTLGDSGDWIWFDCFVGTFILWCCELE